MSTKLWTTTYMPYMKKLTTPLLAFVLAPISYSLLGIIIAMKSQAVSWGNLLIVWLFLLLLYGQTIILKKFSKLDKTGRIVSVAVTNTVMAVPLFYMFKFFPLQLAILCLLMIIVNHSYMLAFKTNHPAYFYHVCLNSLATFTLGNFLMYCAIAKQIPQPIFILFLCYGIFGMSVIYFQQKKREQLLPEKLNYAMIQLIISIGFMTAWFFGYVAILGVLRNHYSLIGLVIMMGTSAFPIMYQLLFKRVLTANRSVTYWYWYMTILAFLLAIFYHL